MIRKTRVARSISRYIKDGFVNRRPALPSLFSSIVVSPMRFGKRAIILALSHHSILRSDLYPSLFFGFVDFSIAPEGEKKTLVLLRVAAVGEPDFCWYSLKSNAMLQKFGDALEFAYERVFPFVAFWTNVCIYCRKRVTYAERLITQKMQLLQEIRWNKNIKTDSFEA